VLVVVDESPLGRHTAALGSAVAATMRASVVFHLPVAAGPVEAETPADLTRALPDQREAAEERARPVFEAAERIAAQAGIGCETVLTIDEVPAEAVRRVAAEKDCGLIVVGSQGRGPLTRMLRGSLVDELIHGSDRPVLVCREDMRFGAVAAL
jgi:nucleotide-binding universal stress UspA family protein